ncbi:MAG TPA: antitoxin [Pseudonocardiaceae bacterium]
MPLLRKLTMLAGAAEAARRYVRANPDKVTKAANRAAAFVDKRTKGRYSKQLSTATQKVRTGTNKLAH